MSVDVCEIEKTIEALRKRLESPGTSSENDVNASKELPVVQKDPAKDKIDRNGD